LEFSVVTPIDRVLLWLLLITLMIGGLGTLLVVFLADLVM